MLTLQFGQCGNQLGHALFSSVSRDIGSTNTGVSQNVNYQYTEDTFNRWFGSITKDGKHLARAILVDTEQKVINKIYNDTSMPWSYCTKNIVCQVGGGSANNWAYGYTVKGHQLNEIVLDITRKEIEKLDRSDGFLLLLSSAGGTGSGVGSHIIESLREEYETKALVGAVIFPFSFGEVCTQNYNTLLTLAKLYEQLDAAILFENEQIHAICSGVMKKSDIGLQDMNEIISEKLAAVFQPVKGSPYSMNSLVSQISSHYFKFSTIKSTPHIPVSSTEYESVYKWQLYIHHLKQMLRISTSNTELINAEAKLPSSSLSSAPSHMYSCSVSNVLITRGISTEKDNANVTELEQRSLYSKWVPSNRLTHLHQKRRFVNKDKFLALLTNNSQISQPLNVLLNRAWNSYIHGAFLHQYKQFGLEDDDFLRSFAKVENITKEYEQLGSQAVK